MRCLALLRGVTPTGRNRIPSMSSLAGALADEGFENVQTYLQSGNILLDTGLSRAGAAEKIHSVILEKIGPDLTVIVKTREELAEAVSGNPFGGDCDSSRIHLTFTNDAPDAEKVKSVEATAFDGEKLVFGSACFYLYLPRGVARRVLYSGYLEKHLGIRATTRKLGVVQTLCELAAKDIRAD